MPTTSTQVLVILSAAKDLFLPRPKRPFPALMVTAIAVGIGTGSIAPTIHAPVLNSGVNLRRSILETHGASSAGVGGTATLDAPDHPLIA